MPTEADTCRTLITPKLQTAGWEHEPHSIAEQRAFTDGRIIVHGSTATRRKGKRADYILRYTRDFPIAVVEAKPEHEPAATGLQQAKDYADVLQLKFAYATNGIDIIEFDYITGLEQRIPAFPSPADLWSRLRTAENLVDDPKDKIFAPFGDARWKIEGGVVSLGRELYFSTYQSIAKDDRRPGLYKEFPPDFFDLVIVDECHRGSAREESNWREILDYFEPAFQLGMTATPLRDENRDTYLYFGNPIYQYSLKQGIDDGFLAPYRVHRIVTQ